jgi:hypothetical protein
VATGSVAAAAGLKPHDYVEIINGTSTKGMSHTDVVERLAHSPRLELVIRRPDAATLHKALTLPHRQVVTLERTAAQPKWKFSVAGELFHKISLVSPLFSARVLWQIALPPLGGVAAICHRPLGGWHPKQLAKPDQF